MRWQDTDDVEGGSETVPLELTPMFNYTKLRKVEDYTIIVKTRKMTTPVFSPPIESILH